MTAAQPMRRSAPRGEPEIRAAALRDKVWDALEGTSMLTSQIVAHLGEDNRAVYRALLSLQDAGMVKGRSERGSSVLRAHGRIWTRCDARPTSGLPPRDPLLWALFGSPP